MAKKTNKTSHVLNLLSGAEEQDVEVKREEEPKIQIVNQNEEDSIAEGVQQLLEEELMQEERALQQEKGAEESVYAEEIPAVEEPETAEPPEEEPAEPVPEKPEQTEAEQAEPVPVEKEPQYKEPQYVMVNVMEKLVDEKLDYYMNRFDVCGCSRCRVDVKAYALTHMESKYVVMDKGGVSAFLNFYSNKFSGEVMSHLAKACMRVNEEPRH